MSIPWVAAITIIGIVIAGVAGWLLKPPEPKQVMRFTYELPEGQQFNIDPLAPGHTLALSANGSKFIYSTMGGLYIRSENELEARLIPGTEKDNPQSPFFSPDRQRGLARLRKGIGSGKLTKEYLNNWRI